MSQIKDYGDGNAITREACAWIAQLDGDQEPSAADLAALRDWMNRSPAHRMELKRLAEVWGHLNVLTELAGTAPAPLDERNAGYGRWLTVPMALVVIFGVLLAVVAGALFRTHDVRQVGAVVYRTAVGGQLHQRLKDGSALTLNTDSRVQVAFSAQERAVTLLHGEAHFEVTHDRNRPFIVYAGGSQVRAVGTAFSVRVRERDVDVVVTEGTVELRAASTAPDGSSANAEVRRAAVPIKQRAMVEAGQSASFSDHVESVVSVPADELARRVAWQKGMLVFAGDRLDAVVREVSRYTERDIEFADPALRELRIGGQFRVGEIDQLFDVLETSFGIEVQRNGERVVLSMPPGTHAQ